MIVGTAMVAIAALLWSFDGTFLRPQLFSLPLPFIIFFEHLLGFLVLSPFLWIYRAQLRTIARKQWAAIFWIALFGGALGTLFFTKALFLTGFVDISVVILLQKLQPIFAIALAAVLLKERFPRSFYAYAALALIAGYFVTFADWWTVSNITSTSGAIAGFALLAAFAWGSSTVFGKYSLKGLHHGLLAALRFGLTVLIMLPFAWQHLSLLGGGIEGKLLGIFVVIALTSGSGAMFLYYRGLAKIPASIATLAELAWPVSAIAFDYFLNGNVLSVTQLLAAAVLVAAVSRVTYLSREEGKSLNQKAKINTA